MVTLNLPRVSYDYLRQRSEAFLREHGAWGAAPVPIEDIIDLRLGIDIISVPGLLRSLDIDAFISSDCRSITVDEGVYLHKVPHRYRFSLAHELAHAVLHREAFASVRFSTISQYKQVLRELSDVDINRMEWQAYNFAGLVLVPTPALVEHFDHEVERAASAGVDVSAYWDEAVAYISSSLTSVFKASAQVISKRIELDNLLSRVKRTRR